jgi:hypothetical protein
MVEWVGNYTHVSVEYNESGILRGLHHGFGHRQVVLYSHGSPFPPRIISGLCRITAQR